MLDSIFYYMSRDHYADWRIYGRKCSSGGNIEFSVPHFLCDGRSFMRTIPPLLIEMCENFSGFEIPSSSLMNFESIFNVPSVNSKTHFQAILLNLITSHNWSAIDHVAIAVDVSDNLGPEFAKQGNRVTFPIFKVEDLIILCNEPKEIWNQKIREKALIEIENYRRISSFISKVSLAKRLALYEKLPIQSAVAVISYFGAIEKFVKCNLPNTLSSFDFAVSASRGPRQIILGFSIGRETFFRTIHSNQEFNWNIPVKKFYREGLAE